LKIKRTVANLWL